MPRQTVADIIADTLHNVGVRRIYGTVGDSLNGLTDSLRQKRTIDWIHVRHEESAAFAAGAEAHLTGQLTVCAGSCGPGNLHLINGLYDCHRSRVPVLAIAAHIPTDEIGSGYFQEPIPARSLPIAAITSARSPPSPRSAARSTSRSARRSPSAASRSWSSRATWR